MSVVQAQSYVGGSLTSHTFTFSANVQAGSVIALGLAETSDNNQAVSTLSDSQGGSLAGGQWTSDAFSTPSNNSCHVWIFTRAGVSGAALSVTLGFGSALPLALFGFELTGRDYASRSVGTQSNVYTGGGTTPTTPIPNCLNGDEIVTCMVTKSTSFIATGMPDGWDFTLAASTNSWNREASGYTPVPLSAGPGQYRAYFDSGTTPWWPLQNNNFGDWAVAAVRFAGGAPVGLPLLPQPRRNPLITW